MAQRQHAEHLIEVVEGSLDAGRIGLPHLLVVHGDVERANQVEQLTKTGRGIQVVTERGIEPLYGGSHPPLFGFIDSLEAVSLKSPGLEFLEGSYFWEAYPRYAGAKPTEFDTFYRGKVGVDQYGASVSDANDVSTYSHMFGCWETLYIIKQAMEAAGYKGPDDRAKLIEATEAITTIPEGNEHPQGDKIFNGKLHQAFGHQNITQVKGGLGELVYRTTIEEGLYDSTEDYTKMAL